MFPLDLDEAITLLEDYGYSYQFSTNALTLARANGSWVNRAKDVTVKYTATTKSYVIDIIE